MPTAVLPALLGGAGPSSPDGSSTQPDSLGGDGSSSTLAGCASAIIGLARELNARRTEVVNLNSNGINNKNPDGTYTYYLPDPPEGTTDTAAYWASMDTASNVRTYNSDSVANGKKEAKELQAAINSGDQAKVDKVLAEIDKHRDVPTYGASFYKQCGGPRQYLQMVNSANQHFQGSPETILHVTNSLGHVLAGASQSEVGGDGLGRVFANEIARTHSGNDVAAFNGLTSAPGTIYGTGFLVGAADILEEIDAGQISAGTGYLSTEFSEDPLAGALTGMGNNSKAALAYLSGEGLPDASNNWLPDAKTEQRWKKLASRNWKDYGPSGNPNSWCSSGLDGFTAALAAASSYRNADSSHSSPESDSRATYVSANAISYFGGDGSAWGREWSKEDFSDKMKKNLAVVIGNSPEEVVAAASDGSKKNRDGGPSLFSFYNPAGGGNRETGEPGMLVGFGDISTLIYRLGDNEDAMTTISARVGKYHHDQKELAMAHPEAGEEKLAQQYGNTAATMAYLQSLSNARVADDMASSKADAEAVKAKQQEVVGTSLSVLSTVAVAGVTTVATGGSGWPLAASMIAAAGQPIAKDALVDAMGGVPAVSQTSVGPNSKDVNIYSELKAQAYADASNRGMFSQPSAKSPNSSETTESKARAAHPDWYTKDKDGNLKIDPQSLTGEQIREMQNTWPIETTDEEDSAVFNKVKAQVAAGETTGRDSAESAPPRRN